MPKSPNYSKTTQVSQFESYLVPNVDIRWSDQPYALAATFRDAAVPYDPDRTPGSPMQSFQIPSPIIGKYIRLPAGTATGPGLSFQDSADNDTGLYLASTNNPAMSVNGTQIFNWNATRMVFGVAGYKLGIGTTGPDRPLDILSTSEAQLRLTYSDSSVYSEFLNDSLGYLTVTTSGKRVAILNGSNTHLLEVYSMGTITSNYSRLSISVSSASTDIFTQVDGSGTGGEFNFGSGTSVSQAVNVYVAGNNRWRWKTNGNFVNVGSTYSIGESGNLIGDIFCTNLGASGSNAVTSAYIGTVNTATVTRASADLTISTTTSGDVVLSPAGNVKFGSHSAIGAETVTGYITIKDSGGTTRKLAVVS